MKVTEDWQVYIIMDLVIILIPIGFWVLFMVLRKFAGGWFSKDVIVDEAEIGIGNSKITLKKDATDRQIAYKIWVELSTRKIGLPIDFEKDVIVEIYNSWYEFFTLTRELIKEIPIAKINRKHTQAIINLAIDVLNEGVRPHLTNWQAKFRRWYKNAEKNSPELSPQEIQKKYPHFDDLVADMELVNSHLIEYRKKLREMVMD